MGLLRWLSFLLLAVVAKQEESNMPLNKKGKKIKRAMRKKYGPEKGDRVFYASENKGTIKGVTKRKKRT
jgi:hypothetical protein